MINPRLEDYWVREAKTEISWNGDWFHSQGVPLTVFLKAGDFMRREWFSFTYPEGNLVLLDLGDVKLEKTAQDDEESANAELVDSERIREFKLPDDLRKSFGLPREDEDISEVPEFKTAKIEIHVHDNWWISFRPAQESLVRHVR